MAYRATAIRVLAISQMVMGSLMIIFAIASIAAVDQWSSHAGFGFWIGIWVIITGILGYAGARSDSIPNKCLLGTFMGFAIPSCVLSGIMIISYSVALAQFSHDLSRYRHEIYYYNYNHGHSPYYPRTNYLRRYNTAKIGVGLGSCLLILAITEFVVALASSIYCCNALCCGTAVESNVQEVRYITQQPAPTFAGQHGGGIIVINPSGQASVQTVHTIPQTQTVMMSGQPVQPVYWATPTGVIGGVPAAPNAPYQQPYYQPKSEDMPPSYETSHERPM